MVVSSLIEMQLASSTSLNYLHDEEEVARSFPKSADILLSLFHDAEYYQLDGLFTVLKPLVREVDIVSQLEIAPNFKPRSGNYTSDNVPPPKGKDYAGSHWFNQYKLFRTNTRI